MAYIGKIQRCFTGAIASAAQGWTSHGIGMSFFALSPKSSSPLTPQTQFYASFTFSKQLGMDLIT